MERIADALGVGFSTVQRDLESLPAASKPSRPKGWEAEGEREKEKGPVRTGPEVNGIDFYANQTLHVRQHRGNPERC